MANISWLGADYTNVGSVFLPVTGTGNEVEFSLGDGSGITMTEVPNATGVGLVITSGGGGGTPSATAHAIHFEFTDSTDADITLYYNDPLISTMITSYAPETYGQKTVDSASLDNVVWYTRPTETWELICQGSAVSNFNGDAFNSYWFRIYDNAITDITENSRWRVTWNGTVYLCTAKYDSDIGNVCVGNPGIIGHAQDESHAPFWFRYLKWVDPFFEGDTLTAGGFTYKIERLVAGGGS